MPQVRVTEQQGLHSWLLTGAASCGALTRAGLPVPEALLSAAEQQGAIVARTGTDEYMAILPAQREAPVGTWCFSRNDCVFAIEGAGWIEFMAHLSQYDYRRMQAGDWLMTSVAGVNCWLYRISDGSELLLGCDAGYADYLQQTLHMVASELGDTDFSNGGE